MPPFMTLKYNTLLKTENIVFFFYLATKYTFVKSALDSITFFSYKHISGIKHHGHSVPRDTLFKMLNSEIIPKVQKHLALLGGRLIPIHTKPFLGSKLDTSK